MSKKIGELQDQKLKDRAEEFRTNNKSKMFFKSNSAADSMNLDWLEEIEHGCLYIDEVVRHPKLDLISEQAIVKIEQAKRISVASVKHLSKHTDFIEDVDPVTEDVQLSKIMIERSEEAYNTYENRVIYTLMFHIGKLIARKEIMLEQFKSSGDKVLEYTAYTNDQNEKVEMELKIKSEQLANTGDIEQFLKEIEDIKARITQVKRYLSSWRTSIFFRSLSKLNVPFVFSPIKKTNVLLSNVNYNESLQLFEYLESYSDYSKIEKKENYETKGNNLLKKVLENSFMTNYFVLESVSSSVKQEKDNLSKYAMIMINQQLKTLVELILKSGIEISEEEILKMVSIEIDRGKKELEIGSHDIKDKFKEAIDEYMEKINESL